MQTWKALQKEFPGGEGRIDFQALECALNDADQEWLTNIAAQLRCEEPKQTEHNKSLVKNRDDCVDAIGKLRREIGQLEQESSAIDKRIICTQDAIDQLQSERSNFAKTIQKIQCDVAKTIECDKRKARELKKKISRKRHNVRDKVISKCAQVMVLRAGQIVHAEHLEALIEKKPCILANWKYDLKCKRKKVMQLQTKQQQRDLENEYAQREQLEERSCQIRKRQDDMQKFNEELDRIRQQKSDMDCLIRRYTDEIAKTGETPPDVAAVRRFFLSLHGCDRDCPTVAVTLTPENEKMWRKALEVHELQKQLIDRYEENFHLEHKIHDLEMDESVLAVAVDADFPPLPTRPSCQRPKSNGRRSVDTGRCRKTSSHCRRKTRDTCSRNVNIDQWAGFIIPAEIDNDCSDLKIFEKVSIGSTSRPVTPDCGDYSVPMNRKTTCEKTRRSCQPALRKRDQCATEPVIRIASFLQSDSQLCNAFDEDCTTVNRKQISKTTSCQQRDPKRSSYRCKTSLMSDFDGCADFGVSPDRMTNSRSGLCSSGYNTSPDPCTKTAAQNCHIEKKTTKTVTKCCPKPSTKNDNCSIPVRESPLNRYDEERVIREDLKKCCRKREQVLPPTPLTCCNRENLPSCTKAPCLHAPTDKDDNPSRKCFKNQPTKCQPSHKRFCRETARKPAWERPLYLVLNEYESSCPKPSAKCSTQCKDWNKIAKNTLTSPKQRLYAHLAAQSPLKGCDESSSITRQVRDNIDSISCAIQPESTADALSFLCSASSDVVTED